MDIENTYLFRYLLSVHALACFLVLQQHVLLGFRRNKSTTPLIKWVLRFCRAIPIIQLFVTLVRFSYTFNPQFKIGDTLNTFVDFVWSPMFTILLIWLMQVYLARTCNRISKFVPPQMVYTPINVVYITVSLGIGAVIGIGSTQLQSMYLWNFDLVARVLFAIALIIASFEMSITRYYLRGGMNLTSYTLFGYVGAFTYFFTLAY